MKRRERNVLSWYEKNCFGVIVRSSPHIMGCRFDWWKDLMEYMVRVMSILENKPFIKRCKLLLSYLVFFFNLVKK